MVTNMAKMTITVSTTNMAPILEMTPPLPLSSVYSVLNGSERGSVNHSDGMNSPRAIYLKVLIAISAFGGKVMFHSVKKTMN